MRSPLLFPLPFQVLLALLVIGLCPSRVDAASFDFSNLNLAIPDGDPVGIASTEIITTDISSIHDITVTLDIVGRDGSAFNGDFYAYLTHRTGFVILLNRVGRTASNGLGYGDNGLNVTFADSASANIYEYRQTLGNNNVPLTSPLTGTWQPDGRNSDPATVLDTTPVTTSLSTFAGLDPNGAWTLFIADLSPGGVGALESWGLQVTGTRQPSGVVDTTSTLVLLTLSAFVVISAAHFGSKFRAR